MTKVIKHPTAWIPLSMSLAAILLLVGTLALVGIPQASPEDEGTAAHIFQLLIAGQLPIILVFAVKFLPKKPKEALLILSLQFLGIILAFTPVFLLEL